MQKGSKRQKGPALSDVVNMSLEDFNKLNMKDLRKINNQILNAVNKRLKRFEEKGYLSVAESFYNRNQKKLVAKKLSETKISDERSRYKLLKNIQLQERTVEESRLYTQKVKDGLRKAGVVIEDENIRKIILAFEQLKERNPEVGVLGMKYNAMNDVVKYAQKHKKSKRLSISRLEKLVIPKIYKTDTTNWSDSQLSLIRKVENENELDPEFDDSDGREL